MDAVRLGSGADDRDRRLRSCAILRAPGSSRSDNIDADGKTRRAHGASRCRRDPRQAENRFQFYDILPQYEVVVPDEKTPATGSARPRPAATPGSYLLHVGSFSAAADADRMKANLALLGFESHVQRVTIDENAFNRVRIGPIVDLDAAKRTQRQLRAAGYDTMLMQVPK